MMNKIATVDSSSSPLTQQPPRVRNRNPTINQEPKITGDEPIYLGDYSIGYKKNIKRTRGVDLGAGSY